MAEKITCPKCGEEFDLGEGYKKHLEALEKKAVKDADKRNKVDYEKRPFYLNRFKFRWRKMCM